MSRTGKAVICREWNKPVVVEEIRIDPPQRNEVTIKLAACGVCHSDLSATNGTIQLPPPLILGHEGAGVVVEVGEGVTAFQEGDHVISSFISMCGKCRQCSRGRPVLCENAGKAIYQLPDGVRTFDRNGQPLNLFMACGVMAEYATLHVDNLVKIDKDVPLDKAALVSCGVMTGVGAVFNTAQLEPGSHAAVFGVGGVGLNTVQGCKIAGADKIIAVDTNPAKLEMAREFGATHTIDASKEENVAKAIKNITGGGVDYAFECIGVGAVVSQAFASLAKGGTAVVLGVAKRSDETVLRTLSIPAEEKAVKGSWFGSARPQHDFPQLLSLYKGGKLKLDELITRTYSIDEAPQAFEDLQAGRNARGVIVFD